MKQIDKLLTQCRLLFCSRLICIRTLKERKIIPNAQYTTRYQRETASNRCGLSKRRWHSKETVISRGNVHILFLSLFLLLTFFGGRGRYIYISGINSVFSIFFTRRDGGRKSNRIKPLRWACSFLCRDE